MANRYKNLLKFISHYEKYKLNYNEILLFTQLNDRIIKSLNISNVGKDVNFYTLLVGM